MGIPGGFAAYTARDPDGNRTYCLSAGRPLALDGLPSE